MIKELLCNLCQKYSDAPNALVITIDMDEGQRSTAVVLSTSNPFQGSLFFWNYGSQNISDTRPRHNIPQPLQMGVNHYFTFDV